MAENKVRIGIVGANVNYGWGSTAHLPALLALPEYELAAVCTAHRETAQASAEHYGARLAFHDYNELINHPDIDLVSVCVRVPSHHAIVMAALGAGKHVFSEWPLGANVKEAEEMASLARSKGVRTMVGLQARGDPGVLRLRELLEEGYVGEVLACNMTLFTPGILQWASHSAWQGHREYGANTLTISAGHAIDALCYCVGEFSEVTSRVTTQVPVWETSEPGKTMEVTSPDNVLVSGALSNGATASVHVATVPWHGSWWRMEVYGKEGTLVASSPTVVQFGQIKLYGGLKSDEALQELPVPDRLAWVPGDLPMGQPPYNVAQMYRRLGEAIGRGEGVQPDFGAALSLHRLLNAIERSSDQGAKVRVS